MPSFCSSWIMSFIKLNENFSIKGNKKQRSLVNLSNGKRYLLNNAQQKIIELCDGSIDERSLFKLASRSSLSENSITKFLALLKKMGALEFCNIKKIRKISYLAKNKHARGIQWELTSRCNLRCLHCYQSEYLSKAEELSILDCKKLIKQMADLGIEKISISGGEPLMRGDLLKIINLLETENIQVASIFTNGTLITKEFLNRLKLLRSRINFNISLDGINPEALKIRGFKQATSRRRYLKKVVENIKLVKKYDFPIRINTILNKANYFKIEEMYDFLTDLDVLSWNVSFPRELGACIINKNDILLDLDIAFKACKKLISHHLERTRQGNKKIDLKIQYLFHEKYLHNLHYYSLDSLICSYEGKELSFCIKPNGDVFPCSTFLGHFMGSVKKQSLENIWNSHKMKEIKEKKINDLEGCKKCKFLSLCGGGCRATADVFSGSIIKKDPVACSAMAYFFRKIVPLLKKRGPNNF